MDVKRQKGRESARLKNAKKAFQEFVIGSIYNVLGYTIEYLPPKSNVGGATFLKINKIYNANGSILFNRTEYFEDMCKNAKAKPEINCFGSQIMKLLLYSLIQLGIGYVEKPMMPKRKQSSDGKENEKQNPKFPILKSLNINGIEYKFKLINEIGEDIYEKIIKKQKVKKQEVIVVGPEHYSGIQFNEQTVSFIHQTNTYFQLIGDLDYTLLVIHNVIQNWYDKSFSLQLNSGATTIIDSSLTINTMPTTQGIEPSQQMKEYLEDITYEKFYQYVELVNNYMLPTFTYSPVYEVVDALQQPMESLEPINEISIVNQDMNTLIPYNYTQINYQNQ